MSLNNVTSFCPNPKSVKNQKNDLLNPDALSDIGIFMDGVDSVVVKLFSYVAASIGYQQSSSRYDKVLTQVVCLVV